MAKLGAWLIMAAIGFVVLALLPAVVGVGEETSAVADFVFCGDNGQAVLSLNLSEEALAKNNIGAVFSGFCSRGGRSTPIEPQRLINVLWIAGGVAIAGVFLILLGRVNPAQRSPMMGTVVVNNPPPAAHPLTQSSPPIAQDMKSRDRDDAQARREANLHRQNTAAPTATYTPRSTVTPDWQLGMPSNTTPEAPSERFSFSEPRQGQLSADLQTQLNLLQLAYESSLITRSEYDAKRAALLGPSA